MAVGSASGLKAGSCETSQLGVCHNHIRAVFALGKGCKQQILQHSGRVGRIKALTIVQSVKLLTTQVTGLCLWQLLEIQLSKRNLVCFGGLGAESSTWRLTSSVQRQSRTAAVFVEQWGHSLPWQGWTDCQSALSSFRPNF